MSDVKFLVIKDALGKVVGEHDGYKTFMRQLADKEFRKEHRNVTVEKSGKHFISIVIPTEE